MGINIFLSTIIRLLAIPYIRTRYVVSLLHEAMKVRTAICTTHILLTSWDYNKSHIHIK